MLLEFTGQLLSTKDGKFTSTEGNNKGQLYQWTELQFHTIEQGVFSLRTVAPVSVPLAELGKVRQWSLEVLPKVSQNKTTFKVVSIAGGKAKAA